MSATIIQEPTLAILSNIRRAKKQKADRRARRARLNERRRNVRVVKSPLTHNPFTTLGA